MEIVCRYILLFFVYSFLGWCLEVGCKLVSDHKFINRGFLIGPYCPIYGHGALIMTILLNRYLNDPVTLFIMIILCCSLLEYFTSYFLEKIFHTRWWDYSGYRFNINGRICLETMVPFGLFGLFIMYVSNPFFLGLIEKISIPILYALTLVILIVYFVDNVISFKIIKNIQHVSEDVQKKQIIKKDDTERITKMIKKQVEDSMKTFEKRLIHAFPHLQVIKRKVVRKKLKEQFIT